MTKLERLKKILSSIDGIIIGFSGGVDSSFLLKVAQECLPPEKILAVTASSPIFPGHELKTARAFAADLGVRHRVITADPFAVPEFAANVPERCYYCKRALFTRLKTMAAEEQLEAVVDGTNFSDQGDYRPGMKACRELGIRSPLLEAELTKEEIRRLSADYQLSTWDLPSFACLATRFPYGTPITLEGVRRVEAGETLLRQLGYRQFRLRDHGSIARIEIEPLQFDNLLQHRIAIIQFFKELGYVYVCMDMEGYCSGSLNRMVEIRS